VTLLESVVALVILGLASVGFLELFQGTSRSARSAETWVTAVAYAEQAVEAAKVGQLALDESARRPAPPGFGRRIEVRPWRPGLAQLVVTVTMPRGSEFVIHRLVPAP